MREATSVIAPICREKGVPATFFLTTGFLDNRALGDRHLASLLLQHGVDPEVIRRSITGPIAVTLDMVAEMEGKR